MMTCLGPRVLTLVTASLLPCMIPIREFSLLRHRIMPQAKELQPLTTSNTVKNSPNLSIHKIVPERPFVVCRVPLGVGAC